MRTLSLGAVVLLLGALSFCSVALGQAYPTNNVFFRITMVESQFGRGTMFSIDVDGREYWITAKHIITGAEHPPYGSVDTMRPVSLKVLDPSANEEHWLTIMFSVVDAGKDIDVVALAAPKILLRNPLPNASVEMKGVTLGGDCEFLGFPFGGGWRATFENGQGYWLPYVKHCTISSIPGNSVLILDGINNHGFSGGPVLYQTGANQQIVGVISGYVQEPADVIPSAQRIQRPRKTKPNRPAHVNLNSGFIIAYFVTPAIEAIRKNPVGPERPPQPQPQQK
jgi:hypothetical protein